MVEVNHPAQAKEGILRDGLRRDGVHVPFDGSQPRDALHLIRP
jgi:hypothetical protein